MHGPIARSRSQAIENATLWSEVHDYYRFRKAQRRFTSIGKSLKVCALLADSPQMNVHVLLTKVRNHSHRHGLEIATGYWVMTKNRELQQEASMGGTKRLFLELQVIPGPRLPDFQSIEFMDRASAEDSRAPVSGASTAQPLRMRKHGTEPTVQQLAFLSCKCPFCCAASLSVHHGLYWCPGTDIGLGCRVSQNCIQVLFFTGLLGHRPPNLEHRNQQALRHSHAA